MAKRVSQNDRPRAVIPIPQRDLFARVSSWTCRVAGGRIGFSTAFGAVMVWAMAGPAFHYSEDWQLVINTGTTIVTFLMVFLIQNSQNRESKAVHLKLDELILAVNRARNELIDIEHLSEEQLNALSERYTKVAAAHHHKLTECYPDANAGDDACSHEEPEVVEVAAEPARVETGPHLRTKGASAGAKNGRHS